MHSTLGAARARTRRRSAEDAALFRLLVDRVLDYAIFMLTPDGHIASWNAGAERLKGYTADEIIGQHFERFYTDADRAAGRPARLLHIAETEGRIEDVGWRVRKDGTRFWADVVITSLRDNSGVLRGFAKVTRDMTEQRAAEEQLRQSERRFSTLVDTIEDYAIFLLSPEGTVLTWNQGAQRLKGYAPSDIIGHSFERFYPDEQRRAGYPAELLAIARAEGRVEDEGWRVRKDGSLFWADVIITALRDDRGDLTGFAKVTRDLTERRGAEMDRAARLAAERTADHMARLQAATAAVAAARDPRHAAEILGDVGTSSVGAAAGVVAMPTPDGTALEAIDVRGYSPEIIEPSQLFAVDGPYPISRAWRTRQPLFLASAEQVRTEHSDLLPVLEQSPFRAWAAIPLIIHERVLGILGLSFSQPRTLDRDERGFLLALAEVGAQAIDRARLFESEQIARAQAEDALRAQDEFLSIAAHELRTPVAAVKAAAQLAERGIERGQLDPARTTTNLQRIARSSDRLEVLIEDLLDVSRLRTGRLRLRREQVDLGGLVQEIVSRYAAIEHGHQFRLKLPEPNIRVDADPVRLEQILDNLLSNAVKYSPDGGPIEVLVYPDQNGVTVTVTDHGIGLPAGQETRIFEAFGRGSNAAAQQIQGLGLGLAICRELLEVHAGRIWATSSGEGQGTTVGMWLPLVELAADSERGGD
jgi:PAS domain S-box-containing protein